MDGFEELLVGMPIVLWFSDTSWYTYTVTSLPVKVGTGDAARVRIGISFYSSSG